MIYQWIDLIWIPLGFFAVHKEQRGWTIGYIIGCMMMMRLQVEVMQEIGYPTGISGLLNYQVFDKGLIVYSIFYALYLVLGHYSPNTKGPVFMAASISLFFTAFFVSSIVMVL